MKSSLLLSSTVIVWIASTALGVVACGGADEDLFGNSSSGSASGTGGSSSSGSPASSGSTTTTTSSGGGPGSGGAGNTGGGPGPGPGGQGVGGVGVGGDGAGGGPTCPSFGDPCSDCTAAQCSALYCECYGNAECGAIILCFDGCAPQDESCYQTCMTNHQAGISDSFLVGDCAATSCAAACPDAQPLKPCPKCLYMHCENQMNACLASADCNALIQCAQMCAPNDAICQQLCQAQHPLGVIALQGVTTCLGQSCSAECN